MRKPFSYGDISGWAILLFGLALFSAGCSQSVDSVNITSRTIARPESYISHTDLQGATTTIPTSATRVMGVHSFGGSSVRTNSASVSYRMTSGIGVD